MAFHSLFNLIGLVLFLPLIKQFANFLEPWIKEDEQHIERFIHNVPADVTDAALEALTQETRHLLYLVLRLNMRFLRISQTVDVISSEYILPRLLASASKLEHYIAIKKLEGEIVSYALKIEIDDAENQTDKEKTGNITRKVDNLINAARYGVYSAKSLKDIEKNLESIYIIDNELVGKYFEELKAQANTICSTVLGLLGKGHEDDVLDEELYTLIEKSQDFHHQFADKIYRKISGIHLAH